MISVRHSKIHWNVYFLIAGTKKHRTAHIMFRIRHIIIIIHRNIIMIDSYTKRRFILLRKSILSDIQRIKKY